MLLSDGTPLYSVTVLAEACIGWLLGVGVGGVGDVGVGVGVDGVGVGGCESSGGDVGDGGVGGEQWYVGQCRCLHVCHLLSLPRVPVTCFPTHERSWFAGTPQALSPLLTCEFLP